MSRDQRLAGSTVVVTRAAAQAGKLVEAIRRSGADVVELPLLRIRPPADGGAELAAALGRLGSDDWLAVTSPNGARQVVEHAGSHRCRLAVVGEGTAAVFRSAGWEPHLVPDAESAADLVDAFPEPAAGSKVLIAQARIARPTLADGLRDAGWRVEVVVAYDNDVPPLDPAAMTRSIDSDMIVFASPSAVSRYVEHVGTTPVSAVCIGAVTAAAADRSGFDVVTAAEPTTDALVDALVEAASISDR